MAPQKPQLPAKLETPQPSPQEAVSSSNSSDDEEGRASRILRLKSSDRDLSASEEAEDGWMVVKDVPKKAPALRILPASSPKNLPVRLILLPRLLLPFLQRPNARISKRQRRQRQKERHFRNFKSKGKRSTESPTKGAS
ncbi:hypothetical protein BC829DRAFT_9760 [Chytridium lagenaria]|nr:hypothetical protein BC829DRAFT_9760 [Chytridium lagenaria]